jgi:hypothetical protein
VTFDEATARLLALARSHDGVLTAADVELDPELREDQHTVSAAAHALAASTNVFASGNEEGWFPYTEIRFSELR